MFKMEIKTGGAAFRNPHTGEEDQFSEALELTSIMNDVAMAMQNGQTSGVIIDTNGNKVGSWSR